MWFYNIDLSYPSETSLKRRPGILLPSHDLAVPKHLPSAAVMDLQLPWQCQVTWTAPSFNVGVPQSVLIQGHTQLYLVGVKIGSCCSSLA